VKTARNEYQATKVEKIVRIAPRVPNVLRRERLEFAIAVLTRPRFEKLNDAEREDAASEARPRPPRASG
jgi:hypothetical protein